MFSCVTGWSSRRWPQKGVNLTVTIRSLLLKLGHLVNTPWLAILVIKLCWGDWNVSPQAGTIHMTCTVISYEITLKKCICVNYCKYSKPSDKKFMISCKYECLSEVIKVTDPFLLKCIGFNDFNVFLLAFKLSTFY